MMSLFAEAEQFLKNIQPFPGTKVSTLRLTA